MDNQSAPPANTPPPGPTIPETPPPPASGSEPVPPKIQQHLENNPHAQEPLKAHHTKKFWSVITSVFLLILIAIVAVAWFFFFGPKAVTAPENTQVIAPIVTSTPSPTPDPTVGWETYTNSELAFSLKYPREKYNISEVPSKNIQIALKPTNLIWVAYGQGDVIPLEIYYYRTILTADEWWSSRGKILFNQLQEDYRLAQQPMPSTYPTPTFAISTTKIGGLNAIKVEGNVIAAQGFGDITLTLVRYKDGVYMFKQRAEDKLESDQLLSTFAFESASSTSAEGTVTPSE